MSDHLPQLASPDVAPAAPQARQRSVEVDALRARALRDDPLTELTDSDREWVWRSVLKRVRLRQSAQLAGLVARDEVALEQAIAKVRARYARRLHAHQTRVAPAVLAAPDHPDHNERPAPHAAPVTEAVGLADLADDATQASAHSAMLAMTATQDRATTALPRFRWWLFPRRANNVSE